MMNAAIVLYRYEDWVRSNFIMTDKVYTELEYIDNVFKYSKAISILEKLDKEEQFIVGVAATVQNVAKFYQIQRYGFFEDDLMHNHAIEGAEFLKNGFLKYLLPETRKYDKVIINVVKMHSMKTLPVKNVGKKSLKFTKLLRDAERVVILENSITQFDTYFSKVQWGENRCIDPRIKDEFRASEEIYILQPNSKIDLLAMRLKFIYQYEFKSALRIIEENDCINRLARVFLEKNYYEASEIIWLREKATDILAIRKQELK